LPGYAEAVKDLESGDRQVALTAVAVATFTNASMIDPWGPFLNTFLWLLYFATGKEIGAPWMELRDESGGLSRRLHLAGGGPKSYLDGYGAIRESDHWWNGEILTAALSSAEALEPFFSIALRHCFRAGRPGVTLDDQVGHLTRALDCLCSRYGFKQEDLTAGLEPGTREKIEDALRTASEEIRSLVGEAAGSGRSSQIPAIAARVLSAGQKDRQFGLAVEKLVEKFGLLDADLLGEYYSANPGPGDRNWISCLSYYRGSVFHEGFIDLDSPGTPIGEVYSFVLHLHDLLVRILLKIVGYNGRYQPRLVRGTASETADWFRPGINMDSLFKIPTMGLRKQAKRAP
jgi:hypothetical protein